MNCPVIMAVKKSKSAIERMMESARLPKRLSIRPVTVIAPQARETSAIFLPRSPRMKKPAIICGAAKTTQPRPSFQAIPGPDTKEETEPYVAMRVIARTNPESERLPRKYSPLKARPASN